MADRLTPYQRIMRAAKAGKGVHLSAEECRAMSLDDAIATVAANDDTGYVDFYYPNITQESA